MRVTVFVVSVIGMALCLTFSFLYLISGFRLLGYLNIAFFFITFLNTVFVTTTKKTVVAGWVILGQLSLLLTVLLVQGGIESTGIFWFFTFPPLAFRLLKRNQAVAWSVIMAEIILGTAFLQSLGALHTPYSLNVLLYLTLSFIVVCLLTDVSSYFLEKDEAIIYTQNAELFASKRKLENNAEELKANAIQLKQDLRQKTMDERRLNALLQESQAARAKLAESNAVDQAIFESIGEGLVVADSKWQMMYMNEAMKNLLGAKFMKKGERLSPQKVGMYHDDGHTPLALEGSPVGKALEGEGIDNRQLFIRNEEIPNGRYVSMSARPVKMLDGRMLGAVVVGRDVTEEREEEQIRSSFVSLASHELRAPLASMRWYLEMVLDGDTGKLGVKQREYLEQVYADNRRMGGLINSLLNVSRLEAGSFIVESKPIQVATIVKNTIQELQPQIQEQQLSVTGNYYTVPAILADSKLLHIMIQNMLTNAIKYSRLGGKIEINVKKAAEGAVVNGKAIGQDSAVVSVADTGLGIPEEQQGKIFGKFFRADNARLHQTEGTGLGLYMTKLILENTGGSIWFTSEENKGSVFSIAIPLTGMKGKKGTKRIE